METKTPTKVRRMLVILASFIFTLLLGSLEHAASFGQRQAPRRVLFSSPEKKPLRLIFRRRLSAGFSGFYYERRHLFSYGYRFEMREFDQNYEAPSWRLNWFLFQRTFPNDTLPSQARFNAFEPPARPDPSASPAVDGRWRPIGPTPITAKYPSMGVTSGRVNAIAISPADPQIILVGGATGGIWRSVNGGDSFVPVSDNQIDLAVGAISFSPSDPSIVYAGMGDIAGGYMGTGVLKSRDAGQTWKRIDVRGLPAPGTIANVVVDPKDPKRVYITQYSFRAATDEGEIYASGVFVSEDGGETWRKTKTGLPRDLVHHPTKDRTLYLSMANTFSKVSPSAGVYKSTDGGDSWVPIFTPSYLEATDISLAVTPAEPDTLYVYTGLVTEQKQDVTLLVTRDGGETWKDLGHGDLDIGGFGYNSYLAVSPSNARTIYIGTRDLYRSTDGGVTWRNLTKNWFLAGGKYDFSPIEATAHSDQHTLAFAPSNASTIFIGTDGGLSRSINAGDSFQSLNNSLSLTQFNSISLHPTDVSKSCGGTQDNGALFRTSAVSTWSEFVAGDSGKCLMHSSQPGTVFTSYIYGSIFRFRESDGWRKGTIASNTTFEEDLKSPRIGFYPAFTIDQATGYLYFGSWRLFVSKDQGLNWPAVSGKTDLTHGATQYGGDVLTAIAVGPAGSNAIYTGSAQGRAMITRDGGKNWKDITKGLPKLFITSILSDATDPNKAYVTFSGFGPGHIFRTLDGGETWTNISVKLKNIPVNALLVDPTDPKRLFAGTDVGVYRSSDEGATWHVFNNGLPPVIVTGFAAQPGGAIQISTYGRGAYELIK